MYNVSQALQHLIEMLSCHPVTNTKLLEVASLNMNTVDGVYAFTQKSPVTIMPTCISVFLPLTKPNEEVTQSIKLNVPNHGHKESPFFFFLFKMTP